MEILRWLQPRDGQRSSAVAFDVAPAEPDPAPSVSSIGIGGQLTGNRADVIIADDVETSKNSFTDLLRLKLREIVKEFGAVLKPTEDARIIYLGTPHVEQTLYNEMENRGYTVRIWPAMVPAFPEKYKGRLGPYVARMVARGVPQGTPVEPLRHNLEELRKREVELGYTQFQMQYMLDPTPSDAARFPLKTMDCLVWDFDTHTAPIRFVHSRDKEYIIPNYPSGGLDGDVWFKPCFVSPERSEFQGTIMCIDPSGKGEDETGYSIVRFCQGVLHWVECGGFFDGLSEETQAGLATRAVLNRVTHVGLEPNFGGGAFGQLLKVWLVKVGEQMRASDPSFFIPSLIEDMPWSKGQKEVRILDTLEPAIQSHRVIVSRELIDLDMKQYEKDFRYSVIYQMTRLTRDKGSLAHEDRLESLAMAVEYFARRLARDQVKMVARFNEENRSKELKKLMEISKLGGVLLTDRRIGHEQKPKGPLMYTPTDNTPFDWRTAFGNRR
jgi:hypothetical protein